MEFRRDFFEDEVRNGYYVPGIMKRCWAASPGNFIGAGQNL